MSAPQFHPNPYAREFPDQADQHASRYPGDVHTVHVIDDAGKVIYKGPEVAECGEDFCDQCGDCMHCYGNDPCLERDNEATTHYWVIYTNHIEGAYCRWEPDRAH